MPDTPVGPDTLRGLALRTLFPGFEGTEAPPERLSDLIDAGLGGVVLFGRNIDAALGDDGIAALAARLREHRPDLLIAIDEEGGDVTRLDVTTGSAYPGSAALGAANDPELTHEVAASLAARLRACGIDINFAPVADIDVDPRNPIVGVRAFGSDPHLVARHTAAFVAGQQSQGVVATVKHFPGHGGTAEDSHVSMPVLDASRALLERRELVPFRAAIDAGVQLVMTAHIIVPTVDADHPATLSPAVISGLLRDELGYTGAVMTDGFDMHAISGTVGHAEGAVLALQAGVDAICLGGDSTDPELVEEMAGAIAAAVETGRLSYERLAEAAGRVTQLSLWVRGRDGLRNAHLEEAVAPLTRERAEVRAARRAVVARGDVTLSSPPIVLELQDDPSLAAGHVPWGVGGPLAERLPGTTVVPLYESGPSARSVLARHPERPVVVAVRGVRRLRWQLSVVEVVRAVRPDAIIVDHELSDPAQFAEPYVLTYGASRVTAEAAAELLHPHAADRAGAGRSA
ncbi:MAG TPA: glycoside hydrolase family 3 N-terminal domain-containing protein [Jiangellaceae bacterium]|nr:glycoside hydrolase family 3 N-terminal domain-containing protein [Jiangellaceae bacterium]